MMSHGGEVNDWMAERKTETQQLEKRYKQEYEEIAWCSLQDCMCALCSARTLSKPADS